MSTNASPNVTVAVTSTPVLTKAITELCDVQVRLANKFNGTADTLRTQAATKGYDRKQSGEMLTAGYLAVATLQFKGDEQAIAAFMASKAPDRSKILSLAYPASDAAATNMASAKLHNDTATGAEKIGINDLLKISRDKEGKTTVESILEERKAATASRGAQNGGAPRVPGTTAAPSTQPSTFTKEQAKQALMATYTSMRTIGKLSEDDCDEIIAEIVAEFNEAASETK